MGELTATSFVISEKDHSHTNSDFPFLPGLFFE